RPEKMRRTVSCCLAVLCLSGSGSLYARDCEPGCNVLEEAKAALRMKEFDTAFAALQSVATPDARYLLGAMHLAGLTAEPDPSRARAEWELAAEARHADAAYALAALLAQE